jgi:hypothetical protein
MENIDHLYKVIGQLYIDKVGLQTMMQQLQAMVQKNGQSAKARDDELFEANQRIKTLEATQVTEEQPADDTPGES